MPLRPDRAEARRRKALAGLNSTAAFWHRRAAHCLDPEAKRWYLAKAGLAEMEADRLIARLIARPSIGIAA